MRGASTTDSRPARPLSSRRPSGRFPIHEETAQEFRADTSKPTTSSRTGSALKSTGHLLIHEDLVPAEQNDPQDLSPRATSSRLSGRFQTHGTGIDTNMDELSAMTSRMSNPSLSPQFSTRFQSFQSQDSKQELPIASSRPSSAAKRSGQLQVRDEMMSITKDIPAVSPRRSRPSSPFQEVNDNSCAQNNIPANKPEIPARNIPLSPIRQLSSRIKLHDDGALASRPEIEPKAVPILPIRQPSARLQVHGDETVTSKRNSSVAKQAESMSMAMGAIDTRNSNEQSGKQSLDHQPRDTHHSESNNENCSDIRDTQTSTTAESAADSLISRFVPLHSQWTYGQRVFGRYKKTPYFYSGNIATYLGAGMFMVVYDDGTLDYRARREDIMLREAPSSSTSSNQQTKKHRDSSSKTEAYESLRVDSFSGLEPDYTNRSRRKSQQENEDYCPDPSVLPEMYLPPSQHVMVNFSVTPPREMVLSFDNNGTAYEVGPSCGVCSTENETWRLLLDDETLTMKRLECGVGYEDDSTQVSDSDESSEEDMSMTPWQQMTQTFGMGKATRVQRRRSSISSVSQIDRHSITQKGMKQIIPTPRSLKQIIIEYFLRGNKKVQPAKLTEELVLTEHIRLMDAKLNTLRSTRCNSGSPDASLARGTCGCLRVVYERAPDGIRAYGTITQRDEDGNYAVLTEDERGISVQVVPEEKVDFLPSVNELEQQLTDLERSQRLLFVGQKVQVSLYPGSRFSGHGLITLEREYQSRFNILLSNRIRLVDVPADKISALPEKKKAAVTITEDQFLICSNKVKVYIGDQIYVKYSAGNGDLDSTAEDEKLGLLNGIYSNKTAAVDFADGSTGYEIPPHLIFKRKRLSVPADQDVRSLKNAVLMQASGAGKVPLPALEEGYQVKADHPRKATVESCVVIKTHPSSACDLRFSDGTIAFEVFPSQMIIDSVSSTPVTNDHYRRTHQTPSYAMGDYVLAWSSRFGRYCSAKIIAKTSQDPSSPPESLSSPSVNNVEALASPTVQSISMTTLYTLVFDYGEQQTLVPSDKILRLDDTTALSPTQRLTNYSIDTMGFELSPVNFAVGETVMGRVHGSARYFNGVVDAVNEKERVCAVCFDSSERDTDVPFSAMFSVDTRSHFTCRSSSTKQVGSGPSSSSEVASRVRVLSRHRATEDAANSKAITRQRRHSSGSVGNILKSVAGNIFRSSRSKRNLDQRRGSHMITEIGARFRLPEQ